VLRADGVVDELGEDRFHGNLDAAVSAELAERARGSGATP
jgi:hypothetical protein